MIGRRAYEIVAEALSANEGIDWPPWGDLTVAEQRGWVAAEWDLADQLVRDDVCW